MHAWRAARVNHHLASAGIKAPRTPPEGPNGKEPLRFRGGAGPKGREGKETKKPKRGRSSSTRAHAAGSPDAGATLSSLALLADAWEDQDHTRPEQIYSTLPPPKRHKKKLPDQIAPTFFLPSVSPSCKTRPVPGARPEETIVWHQQELKHQEHPPRDRTARRHCGFEGGLGHHTRVNPATLPRPYFQ